MKKTTKALYAGVAGLALLTTTGGTFAQWTDSAELSSAAVGTGDLRLEFADGIAEDHPWMWTLNGGASQPSLPAVAKGDVLVGTTSVESTLDGDTLRATLAAGHDMPAEASDWLEQSTITLAMAVDDETVVAGENDVRGKSEPVELTITIQFPADEPPPGGPVELGGIRVTLLQVVENLTAFTEGGER